MFKKINDDEYINMNEVEHIKIMSEIREDPVIKVYFIGFLMRNKVSNEDFPLETLKPGQVFYIHDYKSRIYLTLEEAQAALNKLLDN